MVKKHRSIEQVKKPAAGLRGVKVSKLFVVGNISPATRKTTINYNSKSPSKTILAGPMR